MSSELKRDPGPVGSDSVIGLLGSGGQAREAADLAGEVAFFAVSAGYLDPSDPRQIDLDAVPDELRQVSVVAAVGAPGLKRRLVDTWPGSSFTTLISPSAVVSDSAELGPGCVIAHSAVISVGVRLGKHVLVNIGASLSHDAAIGDFTTISPGARLAGGVTVGEGVFIGIGAVVSNGVSIVDGAVIGAGAVVVDDVHTAGVYVGVPARCRRVITDWLESI